MKYFIVHGRTSCPFCVKAVGLLESKNVAYVFSPVDGEVLTETKQRWGHPTVPIVVERDLHECVYESLIGGYTELSEYLTEYAEDEQEGGSCVLDSNSD